MGESLAARHGVRQAVENLVLVVETSPQLVLGIKSLYDAQTTEGFLDSRH